MGIPFGLGLRMGGRVGGSGGTPTPTPSATSTFAMTQLAGDGERFFPRTVKTGGGNGKGYRDVRVSLSSVTGEGTVFARVRRVSDDVILQAAFALPDLTLASTFVDVRVDARVEQVYIDLQDSTGWKLGTRAINVGGATTVIGQSNIAAWLAVRQADSNTLTSQGITPNPNGLCYIYATAGAGDSIVGTTTGGLATGSWHVPDVNNTSGFCNSAGVATYLNEMIAREGVAWAVIGHAIGGTTQRYHNDQWSTGLVLRDILVNAGLSKSGAVVEERIKYIGGTDMTGGCSRNTFKQWHRRLTALIDAVITPATGCVTHLLTHAVDTSVATGNRRTRRDVRKGGEESAADYANTIYYQPWDLRLIDQIHQYSDSSKRIAQNFMRGALWKGPTITSVTRSGVTITITIAHNTGANNISGTGNWWKWFAVISQDPAAGRSLTSQFTVSGGAIVNATTITLTLSTDPGDGHELRLHPFLNEKSADNGFSSGTVVTDHIRDNYAGDSYGFGRHIYPTPLGFTVAAPTPGGTVNAPPTGYITAASPFDLPMTSPTYEASPGSFGQRLNGGRGTMSSGKSFPFDDFTTGFFFMTPSVAQGTTAGLVAYNSTGTWIGLNASKQIQIMGFGTSTFACADNKLYYLRHSSRTGVGQVAQLYNVTDGIDHGIVIPLGAPWAGSNGTVNVRAINGAASPFTGAIDDLRMYDSSVWWVGDSGLPPSAPIASSAIPDGLFAYWTFDGSGADSAGVF